MEKVISFLMKFITKEAVINIAMSILRSQAARDLAKESPDVVIDVVVVASPVLDQLQAIAIDEKARRKLAGSE